MNDQWKRCRDAGLTIVISKPVGGATAHGWINADDVEKILDVQREVAEFGPDVDSDSDFAAKIITLREFED
jgi:hypothetical protein